MKLRTLCLFLLLAVATAFAQHERVEDQNLYQVAFDNGLRQRGCPTSL